MKQTSRGAKQTLIASKRSIKAALLVLILLATILTVVSAAGDSFSLPWWTIDGGGLESQSGAFSLASTTGQPDTAIMAGQDYSLLAGFWPSLELNGEAKHLLYLPMSPKS